MLEDVATPENRQTSSGCVWPYAFSPDGAKLAGDVGGYPRSLCIWDVALHRPSNAKQCPPFTSEYLVSFPC